MNIFKEQREEKNRTLAILEEMKKTIDELKQIESFLNDRVDILNSNSLELSEKIETLDITKIGKYIDLNKQNIKNQIVELEIAVKAFKTQIENVTYKNVVKHTKSMRKLLYVPIIAFIIVFGIITYFYFTNVKYIQKQTEELVKQNELLSDRINNVYWILAEDQKFWYDKESKQFFINNNQWIKDYKKNLQNKDKKK
ncbi:MAG: hypothetical protein MJH09_09515 [Cetobacterium sp.]|nr:hypothetical protein [Cetobacterium sp.]